MKRWVGPKHWSFEAQLVLLILNAMTIGASSTELRHGVHVVDLVCLPLSTMWVLWIGWIRRPRLPRATARRKGS